MWESLTNRVRGGRVLWILVATPLAFGCGSDDPPGTADTSTTGDSGTSDSAQGDTGTNNDTGVADSGTPDAAPDAPADGAPDAPADASGDGMMMSSCMGGMTYTYVLNAIDYAQTMGTISEGFNLDGVVSDATDTNSCNRADFTRPAPASTPGIDNQMASVLDTAASVAMIDVSQELANGLAAGDLLVIVQVHNVDDLVSDDCVTVDILFGRLPAGVTTPMLDAMNRIAAGQTFDINAMRSYMAGTMTPLVSFPGSTIVGGQVSISSTGTWPVDFPTPSGPFTVTVRQPRAIFDITATTITNGVVGGSLRVSETSAAIAAAASVSPIIVDALLYGASDLDRMGTQCESISLALEVEGVEAMTGMVL